MHPPLANLSRKKLWTRKHERTRKLLYGSKQLLTDNNYSQGLNVKEIKMLSLCLPFMGFACAKSPLMRVLIFFGKPFEASPENEPPPSRSHYGKTKYGDKIAPCGRKKWLVQNCLEDSTIRNPVHTRETRMCGGYSANPYYCLEGSTPPIRYSLPGY